MSYKTYDHYKNSNVTWLGKIPINWELERLGYHTTIITGHPFNSDLFSFEGMPLIRIRDLKEETTSLFWNDEYPAYSIVNKGDLLVGMDGDFDVVSWKGNEALLNQRIFKINAKNKLIDDYLKFILQIPIAHINNLTMSTTVKHLSVKDVKDIQIPIPSIKEQEQISNYLDKRTTKINKTINKNNQLIDLLEEKRIALINHSVTKGLDQETTMKYSGVEWIGAIPEHWDMMKISHLFKNIGSGTTPKSSNEEYYMDGTVNWLITGDLNDDYINETSTQINMKALHDISSLKIYPKNSLVIAMYGATIGKLGILNVDACTNQACCVLSKSNLMNIKYLYYWFLGYRNDIVSLSYGGGQPNISQDVIKNLKCSVPPLEEQKLIVNYLDMEVTKITKIMDKVKENINLLEEFKTSLIYDVVTGKIDVRGEKT